MKSCFFVDTKGKLIARANKRAVILAMTVENKKETPLEDCLMMEDVNKALQRRVISVSEMFAEH